MDSLSNRMETRPGDPVTAADLRRRAERAAARPPSTAPVDPHAATPHLGTPILPPASPPAADP